MYKLLQIISIWTTFASTVRGEKLWFDYDDPRVVCHGSSGWDHKHCENIPQFVCQGLSEENRKVFTWLCEPHTSLHFVQYNARVLTAGLYVYDMDDKLEEVINPTYTLRVEKKLIPLTCSICYFLCPLVCFVWSFFYTWMLAKRHQPTPDGIETFLLEAKGSIGSVVNTDGEIGVHFTRDEMHDLSLATKRCRDTNLALQTELKKVRNALHDLLTSQHGIRSLIDQLNDKDDSAELIIYAQQVKRLEAITRNLSKSIQTPDKKKD
jgi:hypothetical protein